MFPDAYKVPQALSQAVTFLRIIPLLNIKGTAIVENYVVFLK